MPDELKLRLNSSSFSATPLSDTGWVGAIASTHFIIRLINLPSVQPDR
ncbi:hypothetical protein J5X98_09455 [Leptothermofonsia sichuanensis E412]|nr:hypothetical protein [Leptothermofonsia sichuanensis]QZZ22561.1 hypothetical protein J5X98_09455 [Leptothermofonsia sichuanensis E412]